MLSNPQTRTTSSGEVSDLQLKVFYILLGVGCLAHEYAWYGIFLRGSSLNLANYLDAFRELLPTIQISGMAARAVHFVFIALALGMILTPWRVFCALCQFPVTCYLFFLQGTKPANHFAFLTFLLGIHLLYIVFRATVPKTEAFVQANRRFLKLNVLILLVSTYVVAGVTKLNYDYIDPDITTAVGFAWKPLSPFNHALGLWLGDDHPVRDLTWKGFAVVGIVFTFVFEFGIPLLFVVPSWRKYGICVGVLFHLLILFFSAIDFSMVAMSTYPLVLSSRELSELLRNLRRPRLTTTICAFGIATYLTFVSYGPSFAREFAVASSLYRIVHIYAVSYLFCVIFRMCLPGNRQVALSTSPAT